MIHIYFILIENRQYFYLVQNYEDEINYFDVSLVQLQLLELLHGPSCVMWWILNIIKFYSAYHLYRPKDENCSRQVSKRYVMVIVCI